MPLLEASMRAIEGPWVRYGHVMGGAPGQLQEADVEEVYCVRAIRGLIKHLTCLLQSGVNSLRDDLSRHLGVGPMVPSLRPVPQLNTKNYLRQSF